MGIATGVASVSGRSRALPPLRPARLSRRRAAVPEFVELDIRKCGLRTLQCRPPERDVLQAPENEGRSADGRETEVILLAMLVRLARVSVALEELVEVVSEGGSGVLDRA